MVRPTIATLAAVAAGAAAASAPVPAVAQSASPPDHPMSEPQAPAATITVQDLTADGAPLGPPTTLAVDAAGGAEAWAAATARSQQGGGGSSSPSGCRRVDLSNEVETSWTGDTAYRFVTWLSWCWNRSAGTTDGFEYGHYLRDVSPFHYWRGVVAEEGTYYTWRSGYNKSGFKYHRQGRVENCVLKYGCVSNSYPSNIIRAHSDGTYSWWTDD